MQKNYPSIKNIATTCHVDNEAAGEVRAMMQASRADIYNDFPGIEEYARRCYNPPELKFVRMQAIDRLLNTHGVEGFRTRHGALNYCNAGDTYAGTVIYYQGRFSVGSWGDIVEREGGSW